MLKIKYRTITKRYGKRIILDQLRLTLHNSASILLTGHNGAGKTTLLRIMAGLEKPAEFIADVDDQRLNWKDYRKAIQRKVIYMHQQPFMFEGTVAYNLGYALRADSANEKKQRIEHALDWANLSHLSQANAKTLSGGECQRVALARAWLRQPKVLLLDEPMANMDSESRNRTLRLLSQLRDEGISLLISSHDPEHFISHADEHLNLQDGRLKSHEALSTQHNVTPMHDTPLRLVQTMINMITPNPT